MRIQVINVESEDSRVPPTSYCLLGEHKQYYHNKHYKTKWIAGATDFGAFLVGLEKHEDNVISFASSSGVDEDYIVWIGDEGNPY